MSIHKELLLGAHISIAGGFEKALTRGESIGCTAIQIFTKNNQAYFGKDINKEDVTLFRKTLAASSIKSVIVHCSYLVNIGASNPDVEKKSISGLIHELARCEQLGIPYLVLHPGAHTGAGEEVCLKQIAHNLDNVLHKVPGKSMILLETAAGQGTTVGSTFQQLATIRSLCKSKARVGICLDTCHVFVAGYDISTPEGYKKMWKEFDEVIGYDALKAIHLNDSKTSCGERKDRHENLKKGKIPIDIFALLMNDKKLATIPKVLETPSVDGLTEYKDEIALLKSLINNK